MDILNYHINGSYTVVNSKYVIPIPKLESIYKVHNFLTVDHLLSNIILLFVNCDQR